MGSACGRPDVSSVDVPILPSSSGRSGRPPAPLRHGASTPILHIASGGTKGSSSLSNLLPTHPPLSPVQPSSLRVRSNGGSGSGDSPFIGPLDPALTSSGASPQRVRRTNTSLPHQPSPPTPSHYDSSVSRVVTLDSRLKPSPSVLPKPPSSPSTTSAAPTNNTHTHRRRRSSIPNTNRTILDDLEVAFGFVLPHSILTNFARFFQVIHFTAGEVIFAPNDEADILYLVRSGSVAIRSERKWGAAPHHHPHHHPTTSHHPHPAGPIKPHPSTVGSSMRRMRMPPPTSQTTHALTEPPSPLVDSSRLPFTPSIASTTIHTTTTNGNLNTGTMNTPQTLTHPLPSPLSPLATVTSVDDSPMHMSPDSFAPAIQQALRLIESDDLITNHRLGSISSKRLSNDDGDLRRKSFLQSSYRPHHGPLVSSLSVIDDIGGGRADSRGGMRDDGENDDDRHTPMSEDPPSPAWPISTTPLQQPSPTPTHPTTVLNDDPLHPGSHGPARPSNGPFVPPYRPQTPQELRCHMFTTTVPLMLKTRGETFGQESLRSSQHLRNTFAIAVDDGPGVTLLGIKSQDFINFLNGYPDQIVTAGDSHDDDGEERLTSSEIRTRIINCLGETIDSVLAAHLDLSPAKLALLSSLFSFVHVSEGDIVMREGRFGSLQTCSNTPNTNNSSPLIGHQQHASPNHLYFLMSGRIRCHVKSGSNDAGSNKQFKMFDSDATPIERPRGGAGINSVTVDPSLLSRRTRLQIRMGMTQSVSTPVTPMASSIGGKANTPPIPGSPTTTGVTLPTIPTTPTHQASPLAFPSVPPSPLLSSSRPASHPGWFGDLGLILDIPRTATLVAESDCVLLELKQDRFRNFLQLVPEMLNIFAKRLRSMYTVHVTHLLNHPLISRAFVDFCRKEHSQENWSCWHACTAYRLHFSRHLLHTGRNRQLADDILETYILPNSETPVNLKGSTILKIEQRLREGKIDAELFLAAEEEAVTLMNADSFPRFKASEEFQKVLEVINQAHLESVAGGQMYTSSNMVGDYSHPHPSPSHPSSPIRLPQASVLVHQRASSGLKSAAGVSGVGSVDLPSTPRNRHKRSSSSMVRPSIRQNHALKLMIAPSSHTLQSAGTTHTGVVGIGVAAVQESIAESPTSLPYSSSSSATSAGSTPVSGGSGGGGAGHPFLTTRHRHTRSSIDGSPRAKLTQNQIMNFLFPVGHNSSNPSSASFGPDTPTVTSTPNNDSICATPEATPSTTVGGVNPLQSTPLSPNPDAPVRPSSSSRVTGVVPLDFVLLPPAVAVSDPNRTPAAATFGSSTTTIPIRINRHPSPTPQQQTMQMTSNQQEDQQPTTPVLAFVAEKAAENKQPSRRTSIVLKRPQSDASHHSSSVAAVIASSFAGGDDLLSFDLPSNLASLVETILPPPAIDVDAHINDGHGGDVSFTIDESPTSPSRSFIPPVSPSEQRDITIMPSFITRAVSEPM